LLVVGFVNPGELSKTPGAGILQPDFFKETIPDLHDRSHECSVEKEQPGSRPIKDITIRPDDEFVFSLFFHPCSDVRQFVTLQLNCKVTV